VPSRRRHADSGRTRDSRPAVGSELAVEGATIVLEESGKGDIPEITLRQHDEIETARWLQVAEQLAHAALRAVTDDRLAKPAGGDDTQPAGARLVWQSDERQEPAPRPAAPSLHPKEIRTATEPLLAGQPQPGPRGVRPYRLLALHRQPDTVSRRRPLARRRLRTRRPAGVLIRARNPCVFLRWRLFGWNVRFI